MKLIDLSLQVKTKDEQKYKRVHEDVLKRVDKYENDNQPQVSHSLASLNNSVIICWP